MRLRIFHAADGDCSLLTSADGHHVLVDGGRRGTFRENTWPTLEELAAADEKLDLVLVSHVDADHLSGIAWLFEQVVAWAVYDYQHSEGNDRVREPATSRPPVIEGLWHNAWLDPRDTVGEAVEALAQRVSTLAAAHPDGADDDLVGPLRDLALSLAEGADLRRLVDEGTAITRNKGFRGEVRRGQTAHVENVGTTTLTVLGPTRAHLKELRAKWDGILAEAGVTDSDVDAAAQDIVTGRAPQVTIENRASITVLAEEVDGDRTASCLLTGDAAQAEIIEGLRATNRLVDGRCWCDVVKVQHHGSEHNVDHEFAGQVIAGTYVFCADGAHHNPDPDVVRAIVDGRAAADERPFELVFSCGPDRTLPSRRAALVAAIGEAKAGASRHRNRITVTVLDDDQPYLDIPV